MICEIKLRGHVDRRWDDWFRDVDVRWDVDADGAYETTIVGTLPDGSALHGFLAAVGDENLPLISAITRTEDE